MEIRSLELSAAPLVQGCASVLRARADRVLREALPVHFVVALDTSGSMSSVFTSVQRTLGNLYSKIGRQTLASNTLLPFSDTAKPLVLTGKSITSQLQEVYKLRAGGGTNFRSVLDELQGMVARCSSQACFFVVFLSDGRDNFTHGAELKAVLAQQVHTVLEDSQAICAIHTLGFTAEHDAVMLNSLTDAGTAQGTFQYLQNSQDMQEAVDVTADLLEAVCFTPVVHVHLVGSPSVRIFLEPEDGQQQQESAIAATDLAASHLNTFAVLPVSGHTFIKTMPTQNRVRVKVGTKESVLAISKVQAPALHISIKDTAEYVQTQVSQLSITLSDSVFWSSSAMSTVVTRDVMPLKNVSLRLAELVETMQDAENRRSLSEVVAAAIQSVLDFESNILRSIRDRTLTNHHVAVTTSRFHSSTADRQFSRIESTSGSSKPSTRLTSSHGYQGDSKAETVAAQVKPDLPGWSEILALPQDSRSSAATIPYAVPGSNNNSSRGSSASSYVHVPPANRLQHISSRLRALNLDEVTHASPGAPQPSQK